MGSDTPVLVLCNGASPPSESSGDQSAIVLDYRDRSDGLDNVKLGLPNFVRDVYHLPDRTWGRLVTKTKRKHCRFLIKGTW